MTGEGSAAKLVIVAIDGPAASGKGTIARRLAQEFGLAYLDTGSLYRKTAFLVLEAGGDPSNNDDAVTAAKAVSGHPVADEALRTREVSEAASIVSAIPAVRAALVEVQKNFGQNPPILEDGTPAKGAIVDGRDIGTVIFPDADVKLYVTASPEERARRRHLELHDRGEEAGFAEILADVRARDERDASRDISPMKPAEDAHLLDTTDLSIEAAFEAARDIVAAVFK
jgi:cytidylate kinase